MVVGLRIPAGIPELDSCSLKCTWHLKVSLQSYFLWNCATELHVWQDTRGSVGLLWGMWDIFLWPQEGSHGSSLLVAACSAASTTLLKHWHPACCPWALGSHCFYTFQKPKERTWFTYRSLRMWHFFNAAINGKFSESVQIGNKVRKKGYKKSGQCFFK